MILRKTQGHDDPATRAQQPIDYQRRASIALTPSRLIGSGTHAPLHDAPTQENSNGVVPCERPLEILVEMPAIAGDEDELPDPLRWFGVPFGRRRAAVKAPLATRRGGRPQKPREPCPRPAPTARARLGANFKALVAIKTHGKLSQR